MSSSMLGISPAIWAAAMLAFSGIALYIGMKKSQVNNDTLYNVLTVFAIIAIFNYGMSFFSGSGGGMGRGGGGMYM